MRFNAKLELHCRECEAEQFFPTNGTGPLDPLVRCAVCGAVYSLRQLTLERLRDEERRLEAELALTDFSPLPEVERGTYESTDRRVNCH